jgi:hypothetical protein
LLAALANAFKNANAENSRVKTKSVKPEGKQIIALAFVIALSLITNQQDV